ncbi:MAG: MogA/MoaB family molybdenum cofactor biosynthesis protein [Deltaproteobacteria bacterium]|nr:MogA/MoaB family molybdenum cofactor biosynthesis protein [Deltaproteobacteria bacterium]
MPRVCSRDGMRGDVLLTVGVEHVLAGGVIQDSSRLRSGDILAGEAGRIQLVNRLRLPAQGCLCPAWTGRVLSGEFAAGERECVLERSGFSLAWITLSDKGARGEREDLSGPAIRDTVATAMDLCLATGVIIPDEPLLLKETLVEFCLGHAFDMVFTTGGTGVGPRDITPEVTLALLDRRLPGFERVMTAVSVAKTPHGMISRAVAGTMGDAVVVNLPGSPKAVRENLGAILPALGHAIEKLQGDTRDCGQ